MTTSDIANTVQPRAGHTFHTVKVPRPDVMIADWPAFSDAMCQALLDFRDRMDAIIREFAVDPHKEAAE